MFTHFYRDQHKQCIKDTMQRLLQHLQAKDQPQHSLQVTWNMALLHTCISGQQMLKNFTKDYDFKDSDFAVQLFKKLGRI